MKTLSLMACGAIVAASVLNAADPPRVQVEVKKAPIVAPPASQAPEAAADVDAAGTIRASELMGTELVLQDGSSSGKIADFVIDQQRAQITYLVVETDGQYRAVPYSTISLNQGEQPEDRYVVLGVEPQRFLEAPAIPQDQWRTYTSAQWRTYVPTVTKFYSNVQRVTPGEVRRADRAINRNIRQGERQAERKLD
jgi:sporulation protein YlmC with PRC-barrel domain